LEREIRLAIALHDVGKMDQRWQKWAHKWQRRIGVPVADEHMLAHTDFDPDNPLHRAAEAQGLGPRPPHAAEGAAAVLKLIHQLLGAPKQDAPELKLVKAVFTAIARHHSPRADCYKGFALLPAAQQTVAQVLVEVDEDGQASLNLEMSKETRQILGVLVQPDAVEELLMYFLAVRALRLADQGALGRKW